MGSRLAIRLSRVGVVVLALVALEAIVRAGLVSKLILSAPSVIAVKAWGDIRSGELLAHLKVTEIGRAHV